MDEADGLARWARTRLKVPTGRLRGQAFWLPDWQTDWLRGALAPGVSAAALSVARKNGKTGLTAVPVLDALAGDGQQPEWRGIVVSLTGKLALEFRNAAEKTAKASGLYDDDAEWSRRLPSEGRVVVRKTPYPGAIVGSSGECAILAADKSSGHAVGADLAIFDEAGLLEENKRGLWNAIQSCVSGRDGRFWGISIRGHGPMFSELIDLGGQLPSVYVKEYAADEDAEIDDREAWKAANPGLGTIKSVQYMTDRMDRARLTPADQPDFRAYDLNLPEAPGREAVCSPNEWKACEVDAAELPPRRGPCYVGFDLGSGRSMTASAAYWPETWRLEVSAAFPSVPDLARRGRDDACGKRYVTMHEAGELRLMGDVVTDRDAFLKELVADLRGQHVVGVAADTYRQEEAEQVFRDVRCDWPRHWRANMSGREGSHDIRAFQRAVSLGRIRCAQRHLMRSSLLEADVRRFHAAEHPSLGKRREKGRIDPLAAAIQAVGLAGVPDVAMSAGDFVLHEMYD